ncbi:ER membrane protein complex subunit 10-like [Xenia sp. Carnegie-2017]|uniref:ER membrane protein complex subunit 10-like n=1 Tax=Xenia sp. Carnegie-2017 TaxID=2897299 RepID=UPI001F044963|nr:ER membrane protein complex subunit 10-like [Xenia sp. Carnegie-2017]
MGAHVNMAERTRFPAGKFLLYSVALLGILCTIQATDIGKNAGDALIVEHAIGASGDLVFKERGHIFIKSIKGTFGSYKDSEDFSWKTFKNSLKDAARRGDFYHIRVTMNPSESVEPKSPYYVSTLIKACSLLLSNFSDIIKLNLDHTGHVFAVGLSTTKSDCSETSANQFKKMAYDRFNTTVILSHVSPGPTPDTQAYIKRLEDERREKERGKGKDNRSFLQKYWMYIIPLVIFVMMSNQEPPAGAGGDGGSGGGGSASAS